MPSDDEEITTQDAGRICKCEHLRRGFAFIRASTEVENFTRNQSFVRFYPRVPIILEPYYCASLFLKTIRGVSAPYKNDALRFRVNKERT